jgi:hypothetical protein
MRAFGQSTVPMPFKTYTPGSGLVCLLCDGPLSFFLGANKSEAPHGDGTVSARLSLRGPDVSSSSAFMETFLGRGRQSRSHAVRHVLTPTAILGQMTRITVNVANPSLVRPAIIALLYTLKVAIALVSFRRSSIKFVAVVLAQVIAGLTVTASESIWGPCRDSGIS